MTTITITIAIGNEAMETRGDVVEALTRNLGLDGVLTAGQSGSIFDLNGNRVGGWAVDSHD